MIRFANGLLARRIRLGRSSPIQIGVVMIALLFVTGCARERGGGKEQSMATLVVKSAAFEHEGKIPRRHTCDGEDLSPPLIWSGAPALTRCYALIMDDPDAPAGTWVHWVAWNIPGAELAASVPANEKLADGTRQGRNSWNRVGYGGPCPPSGTHRYYFKVYALDAALDLPASTDAKALLRAIEAHVLAKGELMGRYARG